MKLEGAKINFLGDSITEGYGVSNPEKLVWHQLIKRDHGLAQANNYGVSGTRIARRTQPYLPTPVYDVTFEMRAEIMSRDVDAVVVFGGVNDFGHGDAHFGDVNSDSEDIYTFCGALNSLISKLKRDFPKAELVFLTSLHYICENEPDQPDGKLLVDYVEAIRTICAKREVKIIDLFAINPLDCTDASLVPDGLHPNDAGHAVMAKVIAEELMKL
ncbi:MAG: SGNH/GDSL hydrolase family protein [Oscillospiraceae bacterium]|nr:SGNH/GDSL hydrolase family protein [Oscillospiraceae bacterium]MBQ7089259.1 SGNH/GDSL hydrolase family protein [Clostridia bacterium]